VTFTWQLGTWCREGAVQLTVGRRLDAHLHGGWDLSPLERLPLQARRAPWPRAPLMGPSAHGRGCLRSRGRR